MARTKRNKQAADVPAEGAEGAEGEEAPTEAPEPAAKKAKAEELKIGDQVGKRGQVFCCLAFLETGKLGSHTHPGTAFCQFPNLGSLETDESTPEAEVRINLEVKVSENYRSDY